MRHAIESEGCCTTLASLGFLKRILRELGRNLDTAVVLSIASKNEAA